MSNVSDRLNSFSNSPVALEQEWEDIKGEIDGRFKALKQGLEAVPKIMQNKSEPAKSQAKEQSGNFPFLVGALVKVAFPELFKRKLISAGDVAYLLSKKASKDFKMRGNVVLRLYTSDNDPGLVSSGHRRYYKEVPPMELGSKKYHLSSQFFPESREPVLKWIYSHGLHKKELLELVAAKSK